MTPRPATPSFDTASPPTRRADGAERRGDARRWFEPRTDWEGKHALLPAHICWHILDVYSWVAGVFGVVSGTVYLAQYPAAALVDPLYWAFMAMAVAQLAIAVCRGWPFTLRYAILAASLLANALNAAITVGIGPNLFFFVLMLISSTALFFGVRWGVIGMLLTGATFALVAWGWVSGFFPIGITREAAAAFLDFGRAGVWARVLAGAGVCMAGLFIIAGQILRRLNEALAQSKSALAKLASEQTQRAQAVDALRASEERFSKVFQFSPDAICVADLESGRYLEVNEGFERIFGIGRREMIGRTAAEIGHWVQPEERARLLEAVRRHGFVRDFQASGRRRDGQIGTFLVSAEIVEIAGRQALITAGHEITERLVAEAALRESEAKFSKVFQVSPISIIVTEFATGRILEVNDAFLQTFDCAREQIIGRTTLELGFWSDPGDRGRLAERLQRATHVRDFRVKGATARGVPITVLINCALIEIAARMSLLTMVQDITEQERAEAALRESEEKFSKAFRSGPDAMAIADLDTGRYLEVNEGFERLFGYARDEVIGRTSLELGIWPSAAARDTFVAQLRAQGAVKDLEIESRNRRHDRLTYMVNAELMSLGGRERIVSAIHDITDRKRAEAERAQAIEREIQARREFTRQLIATQEAERRRIAGELHDSLGQNLLLVKNRAQLALAGGAIPADQRWQFESIHDMATQAIAEVRQISHDLRPYQLDQLGLTRALESMIDGAARSTGFPFTRKLDAVDDVFAAEAATHVYRIVQESLNNILKHARATRAEVIVERDIHHVRLWIEDDGRGFAPAARSDDGGGFGLKNLAERVRILGGTLNIDSAPGRGSRIEVLVKLPG